MKDLKLSTAGDLIIKNGDLDITYGQDYLVRELQKVVNIIKGTWPLYPEIGSTLEEFIGQHNTRAVAKRIKAELEYTLNDYDYFKGLNFVVQVSPVNLHTVVVDIIISSLKYEPVTKLIFHFKNGIQQIVYDREFIEEYTIDNLALNKNKYFNRNRSRL